MRRAFLVIVGFGAGSLMFLLLCRNVAAHYEMTIPAQETIYQVQGVQFPSQVDHTPLRVQQLVSYDGPFLEDGSDTECINVAALLVENTGSSLISKGVVFLEVENDSMTFFFTTLPPGEKVLVLEKERKAYSREEIINCTGWVEEALKEKKDAVTAQIVNLGSLEITNHSDDIVPFVKVLYKGYDQESELLIGGITYSAEIRGLRPGETKIISPYHLANGYSKIVDVLTSEE